MKTDVNTELAIEVVAVQMRADGRMDTANAARYLGLSVKTLAMMRSEGRGPDYVKRGRIFYFRSTLDAWLMERGQLKSTASSRLQASTGRSGYQNVGQGSSTLGVGLSRA